MGNLHWFNPQNDLALAANIPNFTPPKNAKQLELAGQFLPFWYGQTGDYVIASSQKEDWVKSVSDVFDLKPKLWTRDADIDACAPWGWSVDARSRFARVGIDVGILPSDDALDIHRGLSHRRNTIEVVRRLKAELPFIVVPEAVEAYGINESVQAVKGFGGAAYLKLPYSSTGRGVINVSSMSENQIIDKVDGMIRRQGSVMVEKALDKVLDFAMLFHANDGVVRFVGYSAFFNDTETAYGGNIIMPDDEIRCVYLGRFIDCRELLAVERVMPVVLSHILGNGYTGYFGVDMMLYDDCGVVRISPCVEINLRMTMGVVARHLGCEFLCEGRCGKLSVDYMRTAPLQRAKVVDGRLEIGEISLIPEHPLFSITLGVV